MHVPPPEGSAVPNGKRPRIAGIIAEYNPFHKGHLYHLEQTRRAGAEMIVVVMSGCFTQRGDPAVIPVRDRVRMALEGGADAVFLLPALWALRDAEHFALGGVSLLDGLGCDMISFGCETPDLPLLMRAARLLEQPPEDMTDVLRSLLQQGLSYPAALARSAETVFPEIGRILAQPNNTLSVCYLRQMLRMNSRMTPVCIARQSGYLDTQIHPDTPASASAIRSALYRGDWPSLTDALPGFSLNILSQAVLDGRFMRRDAMDTAILCRLRSMRTDEWAALPDQSEGLPDRVRKAAGNAASLEDLILRSYTKRYTRSRVARLIMQAFLRLDAASLPKAGPSEALLLGFRSASSHLLRHLGPMHMTGQASELEEGWRAAEETAWDLWSALCGLPSGSLYSSGLLKI